MHRLPKHIHGLMCCLPFPYLISPSLSHTHTVSLSLSLSHTHTLSLPSCQNTRSLFTCRVLSVWVCYNVRRFEHNFFSELPRQTNSFKQDSMPVLASSLVAPLPVFCCLTTAANQPTAATHAPLPSFALFIFYY